MRLNDCAFNYSWGSSSTENPELTLLTVTLSFHQWKVEHNGYYVKVNEEPLLKHIKSELGDQLYESMKADYLLLKPYMEIEDQGTCEYCLDRDLDCECEVQCNDCGAREYCYCKH